jgi:hypothetical protein
MLWLKACEVREMEAYVKTDISLMISEKYGR